jgi:FtsP/CotA-like multicopper oxidase with cupredoxin domain
LASLFGFLVIEGSDSDITKAPGIEGATEVLMLLSEHLPTVDKSVPTFFPIAGVPNWNSLTNGELGDATAYEFQQGETVLFRVASATVEPTIRLVIPGVTFVIVAHDGIPVPEPEETDIVAVSGGGRVEFLARFDEAGTYTMSRMAWGNMFGPNDEICQLAFGMDYPCISFDIEKTVATITVSPAEDGANLPTEPLISTVELPQKSATLTELESMEAVGDRQIIFGMKNQFPLYQIPYDGDFIPPGVAFGVNQRLATPYNYGGYVTAGTCEVWTVISDPPGSEHSFHVHTARFLVTHIDAEEVETPFWRDTMPILMNNFTAKVCFNALEPGDVTLVHCHAPNHFDIGMGEYYQVIAPETDAPSTKAPSVTESPTETPSGGIPFPLSLVVVSFLSSLVMLW